MFIETSLRETPIADVPRQAREAEELGFDGLTASEIRRDPFLTVGLMASSTERIQLATGVAIAFPRSPMVVAYLSRNLQELSGGRFALGLGTQVRAHVERRFSSPWGAPGPHMREYILALRAIWGTWQTGSPLDFRGEYYSFSLMTPEFNLGPTPHPVPIHLAAVNPYNIRLAATLCEALRVHSFCTPEYLRDVLWPNVRAAAEKAGRSLDRFEMIGGGFIATGPTEEAVRAVREEARKRVAFYGSTPSYRPVFEHHGWNELNPALRRLIAEQRWDDMAGLIDDEVLDTFCVAGTYDVIAQRVHDRLGGLVDRIVVAFPEASDTDRDGLAGALRDLKQVPAARR